MKYRDIFADRRDFLRSTRIDLDKDGQGDFVATPLFAHVLDRVLEGLLLDGPRAISVTGPYGSGKSTTILKVIQLLESSDTCSFEALQREFPELQSHPSLPSVVAIPVTGVPGSIASNILDALSNWAHLQNYNDILNAIAEADSQDLNAIIELIDRINSIHPDTALILVIDEMGKHLEYASNHPDNNDIYLLQLLAEYAARSSSPRMALVTILHQSFESYSNRLLRSQRDEFAKIQGRFEDIAFQLPVEDTLKIIGLAISSTCTDSQTLEPACQLAEQIGVELYDMGAISNSISKADYLMLCRQCAPLHPMTALLMGPMFRHFAQNERSLFSMLGSSEPYGFQKFLEDTYFDPENPFLYKLSDLYEYVGTSLGSSIYQSTFGRRWALIETAMGRVPDSNSSARDLVRAIGLIAAVPLQQLVASRHALELAVGASTLDNDLQLLSTRSIIVHRRFSDSFRLWDGSDLDIEALIEEARRSISVPPLVDSLIDLVPPRPITARKHSMQSGALRWFDMTYLSTLELEEGLEDERPADGDGRIYVVIGTEDQVVPAMPDVKPWQMILYTVVPSSLLEAVSELYYVRQVIASTPALLDDEVARREVSEREHDLEQLVERLVNGSIFSPGASISVRTHNTNVCKIEGNQINALVSQLCDELYPAAPRIINEFVNRDVMSSAATAARNDVLRRMIDRPDEENLGITGYPPKLPIYLSTLRKTGLHRQVNGEWGLHAPDPDSTWFQSWTYIYEQTRGTYRSLAELWKELYLPPYGVRKGLLPIVTIAFMCVSHNRLSILEKESFVPELSSAVIERMLKYPENFMVRSSELSGNKRVFVETMTRDGVLGEVDGSTDLMSLVRPLIVFATRLPEYTRNTKLVSDQTKAVRQALLNAKEPAELLFENLPQAVGSQPIEESGEFPIAEIVSSLIDSVRELADCYPKLLREIQASLFDTFETDSANSNNAISQIRQRAAFVQSVVNDMEYKAIAWRMSQTSELDAWIESVAGVIMKKTPRNWFDKTLDEFRMEIILVERKFVHYETIASLSHKDAAERTPLRVGLTTPDIDFETVVHLSKDEQQQVQDTVDSLLSQFETGSLRGNQLLLIASELIQAYRASSEEKEVERHA